MRPIPEHDAIAAALSRDIYLDQVEFEKACVRGGLTPVRCFDHAGTQAALVVSAGLDARSGGVGPGSPAFAGAGALGRPAPAAWLVFRGTEATQLRLLDIAANLKLCPRPWAGAGWVHGGYSDALERVRFKARRFAERVSPEIPLYVTGHSLGGVLATLYTAWVSDDPEDGHRVAGLVTFGAPKCATRRALAPIIARTRVRRYVMPMDVAPSWPPVPFLYRHPDAEIRLAPVDPWPGPVSRHSVAGYAEATARAAGCP